jgi:hypothetical protein
LLGSLAVLSAIKKWYEGRYVPHKNDPSSPLVFVGGNYERHWTAQAARIVVRFWMEHWKYIITTSIAAAALLIAYSKL